MVRMDRAFHLAMDLQVEAVFQERLHHGARHGFHAGDSVGDGVDLIEGRVDPGRATVDGSEGIVGVGADQAHAMVVEQGKAAGAEPAGGRIAERRIHARRGLAPGAGAGRDRV